MNRKLRNSLSAVTASGSALAIALMVAVPAGTSPVTTQDRITASTMQRADLGSLTQAVALSAEIAAASALALEADGGMDAHPQQRAPHKGLRHRRQTVVMPYFSFLPRG
ncbi:hypothetical protein ACFPN1_03880 [Lysobacter yangpyeongensis]|uniref:Uncharacterized protein n=1 Tax=Lysobacter yangpyeongensis TaxID=346182 RepID=A0ABW0SJK0_9GAMM